MNWCICAVFEQFPSLSDIIAHQNAKPNHDMIDDVVTYDHVTTHKAVKSDETHHVTA